MMVVYWVNGKPVIYLFHVKLVDEIKKLFTQNSIEEKCMKKKTCSMTRLWCVFDVLRFFLIHMMVYGWKRFKA